MTDRMLPLLCIVVLVVAGEALAQPSPTPVRKPGWWEMSLNVEGPTPSPAHQLIRMCTDKSIDRVQSPFGVHSGSSCPPPQTTPNGHGWDIVSECKVGAMTVTTTGHASGDLNSAYHVDLVTRMSPPPTPQMSEIRLAVDARWLGACPSGKKPGDVEVTMNLNVAPEGVAPLSGLSAQCQGPRTNNHSIPTFRKPASRDQ
jgi:hypothetical protein